MTVVHSGRRSIVRGRQAFHEYLTNIFKMFPDLRIQTTLCETGASVAVAEWLMSGTHAGHIGVPLGRGRPTSARVACVFEVADRQLTHERLVLGPRQYDASARPVAAIASAGITAAITFP